MTGLSVVGRIIILVSMAVLSSCGSPKVDPMFVTAGDPFFDDALKRLSQPEQRRLGFRTADDIMGFYFEGRNEVCIVLLPRKRNVILHGPESAFCYHKATGDFIRRL